MTISRFLRTRVLIAALLLFGVTSLSAQTGKLPAERAGTIGDPTGKIAFVRDKNIWVMNPDASEQMMVSEVTNADGRISFAPDNRRIAFTRSGLIDLRGPDLFGGKHKVYDIFVAYLDSAETGNKLWWRRLSDDLGSRDPEWLPDGRIIFTKDLNANFANAASPNYQICIMEESGEYLDVLRKDWQTTNTFMLNPSLNTKTRDIAFTLFYDQNPQGMAVANEAKFMVSVDSLKKAASKMKQKVAPAWSPDGKWLAYVGSDMSNSGIYICTPDLKERFLVFEPPINAYPRTVAPGWSPDSKWVTFSTTDGSVWICDIAGQKARRLTPPGTDRDPAWSK